jgi:hypothetical protein
VVCFGLGQLYSMYVTIDLFSIRGKCMRAIELCANIESRLACEFHR